METQQFQCMPLQKQCIGCANGEVRQEAGPTLVAAHMYCVDCSNDKARKQAGPTLVPVHIQCVGCSNGNV
eukprot:scaffold53209_cov21-Tisochrysis_lutea.AAC.1